MNFQEYDVIDFACDESFQRYCREEHDKDVLFWKDWQRQHPEKQAMIAEARSIVALLSARQGNRLEQLKHLEDGIARYDQLQRALGEESGKDIASRRLPRLFKYAAAIVSIALLAGGMALFYQHRITTENEVVINAGKEPRKTVVLPDGSSIVLRENSTVQLSPGFNHENRRLTLTGEAFFDVTQNAQHPFIVHTAVVDIKVLGTVFNVSAYRNRQTETALFKGKVEVTLASHPGQKIVLQPNQKLITDVTKPFAVAPLDADPVNHKAKEIAWVRNRLEIENEPLEMIAAKLEKWYGIPVKFEDEEVKEYRYSGTFESETILKALDALQLSYPFSYKMLNGEIIISK